VHSPKDSSSEIALGEPMPIFKGQMKSEKLDSINSVTIRDRLVPKMETLRTFTSCTREDFGLLRGSEERNRCLKEGKLMMVLLVKADYSFCFSGLDQVSLRPGILFHPHSPE
jgi:hypothetical protein